jgi:hypothetical protein
MKVTLKSVKFFERMSEETNAFTADVFVNGKKCGYAKNNGHGGNTDVSAYPEQRVLFNEGEDFLTKQPQLNIGSETNPFMIDCDMESTVDNLFEKWLETREEKKMIKNYEKGLVLERPNGYGIVTWRGFTVKGLLEHEKGQEMLKKAIIRLKSEGEVILNTNIPESILN